MGTASAGHHLRLLVAEDFEAMSRVAARLILAELRRRPDLLLCASAGGTPTGTYRLLTRECAERPALFRKLRVLQLDEWLGLPTTHPATCRVDLRHKLLDPLRIPSRRFVGFNSATNSPLEECARISNWLAGHGPVELCILGLGSNGHVAMNEPAARLISGVHVAKLAPASRQHPLLAQVQPKPAQGLTLGLGDILRSHSILLLVSGAGKRSILKRFLESHVTPQLPVSFLHLHGNVTVCCDRAALGT